MENMKNKPEDYWKKKLTQEQYAVCRLGGTEVPFTGLLYTNHETGVYSCVACDQELFSSSAKFDSGTGWPSFDAPANTEHVELIEDRAHGMSRTEVRCKQCGAHLGHLFPDGPTHTSQRFCINSVALQFVEEKKEK